MKNSSRYITYVISFFLTLSPPATSQAPPPSSDIFIVEMKRGATRWQLGQPVNITNRDGYDNQPSWQPDGRSLFYTSIREDGQADIYRYDFSQGVSVRVTKTAESEYSPTIMPGGKSFSVVRVEADATQRLWQFPLSGGQPVLLLEQIKPVGYHTWLDRHTVALFVLGSPPTLQIADTRSGKVELIIANIGRSLHRIPRQAKLSFVHKVSADEWLVKSFDLKTRQIATLIKTLPGSEDLAWTPAGTLLMGKESKLFEWDRSKETGWRELADFSAAGLKTITRLAVSPKGDKLALVAQ
jgi:dipeptidyl aminopeptidase/acylaminoacyl peptidase